MVMGLLTIELTDSCFPTERGKLRLSIRINLYKQIWQNKCKQNENFSQPKQKEDNILRWNRTLRTNLVDKNMKEVEVAGKQTWARKINPPKQDEQ